jgi:hypothetical protein
MFPPRHGVVRIRLRRPLFAPNPDLFSGIWPIALALAVLALPALVRAARGETLPPRAERTATWYADNPRALDIATRYCRDDPGHLRDNPDCVNAAQARVIVAHREAERRNSDRRGPSGGRLGDLTPPSNPQYWIDRPESRRQKLYYCSLMTPAHQVDFGCGPAREAQRTVDDGRNAGRGRRT